MKRERKNVGVKGLESITKERKRGEEYTPSAKDLDIGIKIAFFMENP